MSFEYNPRTENPRRILPGGTTSSCPWNTSPAVQALKRK